MRVEEDDMATDPDAVTAVVGSEEERTRGTASAPARRYDRSIVEGPLRATVWKLAWPTVITNVVGGIQGMIDHAMVGHFVGFAANAAIGVASQIFIVIIVFMMAVFTGMNVLVARFVGAGDEDKVNRTVYQAILTAIGLSVGVVAPLGYFTAPWLLELVNAAPSVRAEALPYLRIMFLFSGGMIVFFLLSFAMRSAGDARTPMHLGIALTVLNIVLNVILIPGVGPIPAFGTAGAALGTVIAGFVVGGYALWQLRSGRAVVALPPPGRRAADWSIIRALFRFGLPTGIQGIAMNIGGVLLLAFIGSLANSAAAQAAYAVSYTQLFSLITWTANGLMGAAAVVAGQNLGAGSAERAATGVHVAGAYSIGIAAVVGALFFLLPRQLFALFGLDEPGVVETGVELLRVLSLSGFFVAIALTYTGGLQGTGDTRSPLYISIVSQIIVPLGICWLIQQTAGLDAIDVWLAILAGHVTRCTLSVLRFNQRRWRGIVVDIGEAEGRA
jgi:putative MATE family efflux protein